MEASAQDTTSMPKLTSPIIEFDLDGHVGSKGIEYIGKAIQQENGMWRCLAKLDSALCVVEVRLTITGNEV